MEKKQRPKNTPKRQRKILGKLSCSGCFRCNVFVDTPGYPGPSRLGKLTNIPYAENKVTVLSHLGQRETVLYVLAHPWRSFLALCEQSACTDFSKPGA
jgi:hypothetical protein